MTGLAATICPAHTCHAHNDHARSAPGLLFMETQNAITTGPVFFGQVDSHGGDDHAVLQGHGSDATRLQEVAVALCHGWTPGIPTARLQYRPLVAAGATGFVPPTGSEIACKQPGPGIADSL